MAQTDLKVLTENFKKYLKESKGGSLNESFKSYDNVETLGLNEVLDALPSGALFKIAKDFVTKNKTNDIEVGESYWYYLSNSEQNTIKKMVEDRGNVFGVDHYDIG